MNTRSIPQSSPVSVRDASDDALVSQLRAGSSAAAGELYRRHAAYLKSALKSRVSVVDAADVVQDVFVVLLANPRFTPAPGRVKSWLRGIAMRLAAKRRAGSFTGSHPAPHSPRDPTTRPISSPSTAKQSM